jgi:hypothetical protein
LQDNAARIEATAHANDTAKGFNEQQDEKETPQ